MSTSTSRASVATGSARPTFRRVGLATAGAIVGNLVAFWAFSAAGATWETNSPEPINAFVVAIATAIPMLLGGAIALAIIKRKPGFQPWAAWGGLAFAVISLPMPFLAATAADTGTGLAAMHVITGLAWLFALKPNRQG